MWPVKFPLLAKKPPKTAKTSKSNIHSIGKFYNSMADCHSRQNLDIPAAIEFCQNAFSLSISIGNSHAVSCIASPSTDPVAAW
jgi:hypothetical protein